MAFVKNEPDIEFQYLLADSEQRDDPSQEQSDQQNQQSTNFPIEKSAPQRKIRKWRVQKKYPNSQTARNDVKSEGLWILDYKSRSRQGRKVQYKCRYSTPSWICDAAIYLLYHTNPADGITRFITCSDHSHDPKPLPPSERGIASEIKALITNLYHQGTKTPEQILQALRRLDIVPPTKEQISTFLRFSKSIRKKPDSQGVQQQHPHPDVIMSSNGKKTVFVIYYSMYGHIEAMAREVCKGLEKAGVNAKLFQVPETLPQEVLEKMHAPPKASDVPIIKTEQLKEADGFLFGFPTRFGILPAQMKAFFDTCGQLWMSSALVNKFYGLFFSTGSIGGGQETTAMSSIPFFTHMGMIYVPIGGKHKGLTDASQVHGGSAWGAGCIASNPTPSKLELEIAEHQGFDFGSLIRRINFTGSS